MPVTIKSRFGEDVRRVTLDDTLSLKDVCKKIAKLYKISNVQLKWTDDEGDVITIDDNNDWQEAVKANAGVTMKMIVSEKISPVEESTPAVEESEMPDMMEAASRIAHEVAQQLTGGNGQVGDKFLESLTREAMENLNLGDASQQNSVDQELAAEMARNAVENMVSQGLIENLAKQAMQNMPQPQPQPTESENTDTNTPKTNGHPPFNFPFPPPFGMGFGIGPFPGPHGVPPPPHIFHGPPPTPHMPAHGFHHPPPHFFPHSPQHESHHSRGPVHVSTYVHAQPQPQRQPQPTPAQQQKKEATVLTVVPAGTILPTAPLREGQFGPGVTQLNNYLTKLKAVKDTLPREDLFTCATSDAIRVATRGKYSVYDSAARDMLLKRCNEDFKAEKLKEKKRLEEMIQALASRKKNAEKEKAKEQREKEVEQFRSEVQQTPATKEPVQTQDAPQESKPKFQYSKQLEQLVDMGFLEVHLIADALDRHTGNMEAVLTELISSSLE